MNAIQQKCRPKHQVLVLKCYPRTTKGAVDVKPNSSELSYLLFYAQSRRSKIQKVGSFLGKKTASDVYRQRIGNVQVTLQILTALIEKTPKDLLLFASCVLQILEQILKSRDITMVESSIPTFEAFCSHHDPTSLVADQAYQRQYLDVVQQYASLASTRAFPGRLEPSKPIALRWRNTGLKAIKSIASSDALSSAMTQQYDLTVPVILENLWTDNEDFLDVLHQRAEMGEKLGGTTLLRRRTSVATVQTAESESDANPIALADTAVDMDKLAEENTGVLAMECLRQIFVATNRSQVHAATVALLKFIQERVTQQEDVVKTDSDGRDSGWAIKMFLLVARWAPVADRFTILITAMDALTQHPLTDDTLRQHVVLTAMIGALLRSDINLIGLSVMDVLLQLVGHIRKLVQMPGDPDSLRTEPHVPGEPDPRYLAGLQLSGTAEQAAAQRKNLLFRLQECIGDLATHVYYADQIFDMISLLLQKLRPSRSSSSSGSPPGDKTDTPQSSVNALADEHHHDDSLFGLTVAKIAALRAIKSVLLVANPRTKMSGNVGLSRSRVPIRVWDGTHWLLRDPDGLVRKAYADAVVTWLDRETTSADSRARDETARPMPKHREPGASLAKRAVSSASAREKPAKATRSHFLQLLHLSIYDNAIQYIDYENDMLLLHVLLAKLVDKLGINAVGYGLPMIFRLQEDIQDAETPIHKVRLGSLVHGYFWILTEKFDFEGSVIGRAIHNEIVRRRSKNFWVEGISMPPPLIDLMGTPGTVGRQPRLPTEEIESEALLPFDERLGLVECLCAAYQEQTVSPSQSPAASPGRGFSHPVMGSAATNNMPNVETDQEIPASFREQMLSEWSRDAVLAAVQTASKSESLNGSRSGTTGTNRLNTQSGGLAPNGYNARADRSSPQGSRANLRPSTSPAGDAAGKASLRSGGHRIPAPAGNGEAKEQVVASVERLKLVLSGHLQPPPPPTMHGGPSFQHDDSSSDSLVSYDMTPSELSFNPATLPGNGHGDGNDFGQEEQQLGATDRLGQQRQQRPVSRERKTQEVGRDDDEDGRLGNGNSESGGGDDDVPPVPPLPTGLVGVERVGRSASTKTAAQQDRAATLRRPSTSRRSVKSRGGGGGGGEHRALSGSWASADDRAPPVPRMDLDALLRGIDARVGEGEAGGQGLGAVTRPPY
ncbi:hypothetical protein MYCTH_2297783 [Thermothelomyces thermophilus ATCC 42464]|uniref:Protein EFR3 n=1 Tax=Thermothelomyces thermophilus (strain ATCC 42464 / BCRC 31852 / DSM 1799) TaxID=573729 RepID=G2Q6Z9_THET4|nr:uncharacterized protein MYCTH_2297783 [Thermothelomyces thermophilus ATCC 42464]AEO54779.1 hypothetical protein MYCTH_2297783 [Thermothelomyces thermophilus ATCC 42464]